MDFVEIRKTIKDAPQEVRQITQSNQFVLRTCMENTISPMIFAVHLWKTHTHFLLRTSMGKTIKPMLVCYVHVWKTKT